jgi:hypothetical protein
MAKPKKDRDRRAVIEQMRRDQQRAERRRTIAIISACAVVALVIVGLAAVPLLRQNQLAAGDLATIGARADAAGCRDVVTKKATGSQEHKPEGTAISYPDAPPAFGPHYAVTAPFERKFYTESDRPKLENLVHNLEHGYNLLWYDESIANNSDRLGEIKAIAAKFDGKKLSDKFIALPWTSKDGKPFPKGTHVAMTHWSAGGDPSDPSKQEGVWQYCAKPSGEVVEQFTDDYPYTDSPEPQAL